MRTIRLALVFLFALTAAAQDKLDVTFFAGADIHIGDPRGMTKQIAINHVRALNELRADNGRLTWPASTVGAGTPIPIPEAVFIAGDLMADNSINQFPANVALLRDLYIGEKRLLIPHAYLAAGNHDRWSHMDAYTANGNGNNNGVNALVRETAQRRLFSSFTAADPGPVSSTPAHYAVTLGNGKLLAVVLSPSIAEPCRALEVPGLSHGLTNGPTEPQCNAVKWLEDTIEKHITANGGNRRAPVVIIQHYGYDLMGVGGDLSGWTGYWWDPGARDVLAGVIRKYNVVAVIDGHTHAPSYTDPSKTKYTNQPYFGGEVSASAIDVGYAKTRGWADVNGDQYIDYCRIYDGPQGETATCKLFDGTGFGQEVSSGKIDPGYDESMAWVDVNGDRKADYCRVTGFWTGRYLTCDLSNGSSFSGVIESKAIDAGADNTARVRFWVDANNDGRTDFCRVSGKVGCYLSTGNGFMLMEGGALDSEPTAGRMWADVDGDKKLDYCRLLTKSLVARCALFKDGFADGDFKSSALDGGADAGRMFIDVNSDGKADFCRVTDYKSLSSLGATRCTPSTGTSFGGPDIVSSIRFYDDLPGKPVAHGIDIGYDPGRGWGDFNADGVPEYCRTIVANSGTRARGACSTTGGATVLTPRLDPGYEEGRAWVDVNRDRRVDYCRVTDSNKGAGTIRCTLATAVETVPPVDSFSVASGYCSGDPGGNVGGFTIFRVTEERFEAVEVTKPTLAECEAPGYGGRVAAGAVFTKGIVTR